MYAQNDVKDDFPSTKAEKGGGNTILFFCSQFMSVRLSEGNLVQARIRCLAFWIVSLEHEHWSIGDKLKRFQETKVSPCSVRNSGVRGSLVVMVTYSWHVFNFNLSVTKTGDEDGLMHIKSGIAERSGISKKGDPSAVRVFRDNEAGTVHEFVTMNTKASRLDEKPVV
ncbi:hypothetical protein TNCV_2682041 [Trichonephila clavipes]|nr:hypothetical protein TNCV_2682041 [Trichonephila clavipes]